MANLGIEMSDVGFAVAAADERTQECRALETGDWPGYVYYNGQRFAFGRAAEDQWFVQPRRVTHSLWGRLTHEAGPLGPPGKPAAYSELAFRFLEQFIRSLAPVTTSERIVLAVPGEYLKDHATEEEKVGLLLGMAGELRLPLAGITDIATAALCAPLASSFPTGSRVFVIDVNLLGAELTLFREAGRVRAEFLALHQFGYAQLLKHLTARMGNRFLRHTSFDILADGRIEQAFFGQTKEFLFAARPEYRFQLNTSNRGYEMIAKRNELRADGEAFARGVLRESQRFLGSHAVELPGCQVVVTHRAALLPGFLEQLRFAGCSRVLRLPPAASASGAARLGLAALSVPADLSDVPVITGRPAGLGLASETLRTSG